MLPSPTEAPMLDQASLVFPGRWPLVPYFWCSAWGWRELGVVVVQLGATSTSRHTGPNGRSDKPGISWRKEAGGPTAPGGLALRAVAIVLPACLPQTFLPLAARSLESLGSLGSREGVVACV